ncbi:MAG: hisS, partial [Burkholderiaceae bacterium]|nr:hisS [Burkholderiaceae bacterium]
DPLIERMGGKPTPGIGFGLGIERVIELIREARSAETASSTDVYVLHQGGATAQRAFLLAEAMRDCGLDVICHTGEGSMKSQMKKADASGAEYAVIVGEAEAAANAATIKALRATDSALPFAEQRIVPLDQIPDELVEALTRNDNL